MKTEIWVTHSYGAHKIIFKKDFDLPFVPFLGLRIIDSKNDEEVIIELSNNKQSWHTLIDYNIKGKFFVVDFRIYWKHPVTDETIDYIIKNFTKLGWERKDTTDIQELKELMKRNWEM